MILPGTTLPPTQKPSLRLVFTTEFGDKTDITKDLISSGIDDLFYAIRDALAGCGFSQELINSWFPEEDRG